MSVTNPQDLTTRILNPRSKNGGIKPSSATHRSIHFPSEAHLSNQETGSPETTHPQPIVSGTGFQGIPPPSSLFRTTMASWRHNQQQHPHINMANGTASVSHVNENIPSQNNTQSMASIPRMTNVSKNKAKEHSRQLSHLSRLQQSHSPSSGALTKKSSSSSSSTPSWRRNPLGRIIDSLKRSPMSSSPSSINNSDPDIVLEFDRDISEFLVSVSGSFLGMNPNELMQSNGLRQLIARNMRWFQNTPDWMKVIGLLVAKKFNGEVRTRNALIESTTASFISSFNPVASSSSSSFISEGLNEEDSEIQPLLIRHSTPIPIPKSKANTETQEDHIPFNNSDKDLFTNVHLVATSSSSSNDKFVPLEMLLSSNETKTKKKKNTEKNKQDVVVVVDKKDKKRKSVDKEDDDYPVKQEKSKKKVRGSSKYVAALPESSAIDILDVDVVDINPCVNNDNDSFTLMELSN